LSAFQQ